MISQCIFNVIILTVIFYTNCINLNNYQILNSYFYNKHIFEKIYLHITIKLLQILNVYCNFLLFFLQIPLSNYQYII